jgi:hypothetical protein
MTEIVSLLTSLSPLLTGTVIGQMSHIIFALLAMSGRVTMLGMSRWTEKGGSYRTIQRWFATTIPWSLVFWHFFRHWLYKANETYVLFGDEVVVPKSGKASYGVDRFYSGLFEQVIPSVSFFTLAIGRMGERRSYPVQVEQIIRTPAEKAASQTKAAQAARPPESKRKAGRPPGSKNQDKRLVTFTPEMLRVQAMRQKQVALMAGLMEIGHLVVDGHWGNNPALQMVLACKLHLVSKLRADSSLYFRIQDHYTGNRKPRKDGDKLNPAAIPDKFLKEETHDEEFITRTYQATLLHKAFSQPLNVVIIVKTQRKTGRSAHVFLFSSDLALAFHQIVCFYTLRFQLEFNFRDAKQFWGLDDFMNTSPIALTNAVNLSLFMPNFVFLLLKPFRLTSPDFSVLDLKAYYRAFKYLSEIIIYLPQIPHDISFQLIFQQVASLGAIHPTSSTPSP